MFKIGDVEGEHMCMHDAEVEGKNESFICGCPLTFNHSHAGYNHYHQGEVSDNWKPKHISPSSRSVKRR